MHPALLAMAVALLPVASDAANVTPGTIAIVADDPRTATDPVVQTFVGAVRHAVLQTGFVPLPDPDHSRYVARVAVSQTARGVVTSAGNGSASKPMYEGGGVSLSLPAGKGQLRGLIVIRLSVVVSRRHDDHVVWTGEATTARIGGTRAGAPAVVAAALSDALFQGFPQPSAGPISVP